MPFLVWNSEQGNEIRPLEQETRIGRFPENDITLLDPRISGFHGRILNEDGMWVFEDLRSSNGSYVNGSPRDRAVLNDGDVIRMGRAKLTFCSSSDDKPAALRETLIRGSLSSPRTRPATPPGP